MFHTLNLPEELQLIAKNEINEIPELVEESISYIRTWLLKQPHINARMDDNALLIYLRGCKFSLEKTKKRLELSYTIKSAFPNIFKNRDPLLPRIQFLLKQNIISVLPQNPNGPVWVLFRFENATPETLSVTDCIKMSTMIEDVILREYVTSTIVGRAVLIDLKNMSPGFYTVFTPTMIKQYVTCHLNAYPFRLKRMHIINVPRALVPVINLFKMFLSKKLGNRITYDGLGEENTTAQHLPLSIVPPEFGGRGEPFSDTCEKLKEKLESYRKWFLEEEQYGCDESKRPSSSKVDIDLFSIDGSFRNLNVD
ncbi:hypothetical protein FQR65_LT04138 [Abscondita terminalis]|nr:hypothetical protein FQR65_LT04138 [Abscondita terminalis]